MTQNGGRDATAQRLGDWTVDAASGTLRRGEESKRLEPKVMQVLLHLLAQGGEVVSKESIIAAVWADTFVGEAALSRCVSELRRALGDDARNPVYIETLPKRGYRLLAEVHNAAAPGAGASAAALAPRHGLGKTLVAAALVAVLFLAWWQSRPPTKAADRPIRSIAVLPMRALSDDPAQRFFAEGLGRQLVAELASLEGLSVVAAGGTSNALEGKARHQIATDLGVDALVTGSVQRSTDHVLVTLELLHGRTEVALWAGSYQERGTDDPLAIEREVATQAAREIALTLAAGQPGRGFEHTPTPAAAAAFERGSRLAAKQTPVDLLRALDQFHRAIDLDAGYARPWAAVADVQATLAWNHWSRPETAYAEAREAAHRALELDPTLPEAHALLAAVAAELNQDWMEAERGFRTAIELHPESAFAHERFGRYLRRLGRVQEALEQSTAAILADPNSLPIQASHAWNLILDGDLDAAEQIDLQIIDLDQDLFAAYSGLCAVRNQQGDAGAVSACERAAAMPGRELSRAAVAVARAAVGQPQRARAIAVDLAARYDAHESASVALATAWLAANEPERALTALEQGVDHRALDVPAVLESPYLRPLRARPRFRALLERMLIPLPEPDRGGAD